MSKIFLDMLNMSIMGSYVIVVIIALRLMLRKAPKIFSYVLWSVAFFRLTCPLSFESIFSLVHPKLLSVPTKIIAENFPQGHKPAIDNQGIGMHSPGLPGAAQGIESVATNPLTSNPEAIYIGDINMFISVGGWIWVIGMAFLLAYSAFTAIKLHHRLKRAIHIHCNIFEMKGIDTPFVFGALRPKIFLPHNLTEKEREYIILHEQTHISRLDHIIKSAAFLILCIHWFNPLVWIAYSLMNADMEMSCDESVIRRLGSEIKKDYSSSLLSLTARRRIIGGCPLAFGENNTKGRIMNILNYKKPGFWIILVSIVAVAALVIGLMANPPGDKMTERDYAEQFVQNSISIFDDAEWADFTHVKSEITKFERLDRFDDILDSSVEIWHIEYRFKPDNINEAALGNVNYVDGWIVEDDTMGFKALVFSYEKSEPQYLGSIFSIDGLNGNGDTVAGRETLLRVYLEQHGLLPQETYKSDHIIVKFPLSTGETSQLLLSQPVEKGDKGIWCVERWMDGNGSVYYDIPITDGRIIEYYSRLQKECDEGNKPYLLDPIQVAFEHINGEEGLGQRVSAEKLEIFYDATAEEFLQTPESHFVGYISNFTMEGATNIFFHLDQIEWLTIEEDAERLKELNVNPDDLPNGYYIYNPTSYPMYQHCNDETEFLIIDTGSTNEQKTVSAAEFAEYLEQFDDFVPPFHVYTRDGYVKAIVEQYVP